MQEWEEQSKQTENQICGKLEAVRNHSLFLFPKIQKGNTRMSRIYDEEMEFEEDPDDEMLDAWDEEQLEAYRMRQCDEREWDILTAAGEFLDTLLLDSMPQETDTDVDSSVLEAEIVDKVCGFLMRKYGISVYRPTFTEKGDFEEYPYDFIK